MAEIQAIQSDTLTTYLCVQCCGCGTQIALCESSADCYAHLPDDNFTVEHACGWMGRLGWWEATGKVEMARIRHFQAHPAFRQSRKY